jgi:asparagine N-glycosylation enzyme membrane subunit Stt3
MTLQEFKKTVKKSNKSKSYKINNSLGVYDAYKYIRKNKWFNIGRPLKESEFYSIIRSINLLLVEDLLESGEIKLPHKMGVLELRKKETSITIDNEGNVHNNLPIDWDKTLELWYEDKESYEKKTLIKMEESEVFRVLYNKRTANYTNKAFYEFAVNKELKTRLKKRIKKGFIDAPLLNKNLYLKW